MLNRYALCGARADLSDAAEIIALMAQDLNDLRRESDCATIDDLLVKGWSRGQVNRRFLAALQEALRTYSDAAPAQADEVA